MKAKQNFINNEFVGSPSHSLINVYNPANEELAGQVTLAKPEDAIYAVECAAKAQKQWRALTSIERGVFLQRLADVLDARKEQIGQALAKESGKSLDDAIAETGYSADITRYHAEWARRVEGDIVPSDTPSESLLLQREPIGVVACLIPFNFPVYTLLRKIAPALITGNTVVVRPSDHTPCSSFEISKAVQDAGLPAGVVNILCMNHEVAETMCTHEGVGMITLTGSVDAGRKVLEYCRDNIAKPSLELGGKTPAIIEPDADLEKAVREMIGSKTSHCGQVCTSIERVYVHEDIYEPLVDLLREHMQQRAFGDRAENPSAMGPLVSSRARSKVHDMVGRAVEAGATLELGGYLPEGKGYFYPPTLLTHCRQDMEIIQEEIFGPVLPVIKYSHLEDALTMANDHQFGLASVVYTENYRAAMKVAHNIEAGEIYINRTPSDPYQGFHAGWKRSGLGGDDGKHGMLEFTQTRLVILNY